MIETGSVIIKDASKKTAKEILEAILSTLKKENKENWEFLMVQQDDKKDLLAFRVSKYVED